MTNDEKKPAPTGIEIPVERIKIALKADVTHKPGAVRLDEYPLLVYAPTQHGAGIRTEDRGVPVAKIAAKAVEMPDHDQLAEHFGTTAAHVKQAIAYVLATHTDAAVS